MSHNFIFEIILFYSNYNKESQANRIVINEFLSNNYRFDKIAFKEVNYDEEKKLCNQYDVKGTPIVLIYKNKKLIKRIFGVITYQEFESLMQNLKK